MKKSFLIIFLTIITIFAYGQRKKDILREIFDYEKKLISNVAFDKKQKEIWSAIYVIATEEYNTIVRESESKGYIEAKQEKPNYRESITIEIRGDGPYRVSFQVKQEKKTQKQDGTYTDWTSFTSSTLDEYYTKLQKRLYEMLMGPIVLTPELQKKVDDFNNTQDKDRKKIVKGKDY